VPESRKRPAFRPPFSKIDGVVHDELESPETKRELTAAFERGGCQDRRVLLEGNVAITVCALHYSHSSSTGYRIPFPPFQTPYDGRDRELSLKHCPFMGHDEDG
jgi:hypothetical protein